MPNFILKKSLSTFQLFSIGYVFHINYLYYTIKTKLRIEKSERKYFITSERCLQLPYTSTSCNDTQCN